MRSIPQYNAMYPNQGKLRKLDYTGNQFPDASCVWAKTQATQTSNSSESPPCKQDRILKRIGLNVFSKLVLANAFRNGRCSHG